MQAEKAKEKSTNYLELAHLIGKEFAKRADQYDQSDLFVKENYDTLKKYKFFSAMIPKELGGAGISHSCMCQVLRVLARNCGSTALAFSMHQHLIAANIWKYKNGKGGAPILKKVAEQQLVLVSTGARDWLESNGEMQKVEGGYLVTAKKHFASQSAVGDVLVTSAPYHDPEAGAQVLHFPVPFQSEGVSIADNWYTMGMRGTGSHTVHLDKVFVPDTAIALARPQAAYHTVWSIVLAVALPLIMSAYTGIAEKAVETAIHQSRKNDRIKSFVPSAIGAMNNDLTTAKVMLQDMINITNNFDFQPTTEKGHEMLTRKTVIANATRKVVAQAMEIVGGQSFFRKFGLERLFRDVQAAHFHPLPEKEQHQFSGKFLLENF